MAFEDPNGSYRRGAEDPFGDPLGIRKDGANGRPAQPAAPVNFSYQPPSDARNRDLDNSSNFEMNSSSGYQRGGRTEETPTPKEETSSGPASWFGYLFGGGTQCCGDRSKTEAELSAKKSNMRPPIHSKQFPDANKMPEAGNAAAGRAPNHAAEDFRNASAPQRRDDDLDSGKRSALDELKNFPLEPTRQQPVTQPGRIPTNPDDIVDPSVLRREKPPEGHLPRKWQWPPWTLDTKNAAIEVYVTDEDTKESRWCKAEPQFRVVDKEGNDAYLCVEYEWDGEFYVQDFGPHHVRKRGQDMTIFQLFALDPSVVGNTEMEHSRSGRKTLDDTDPFMTSQRRGDTGGGVGGWLEKGN